MVAGYLVSRDDFEEIYGFFQVLQEKLKGILIDVELISFDKEANESAELGISSIQKYASAVQAILKNIKEA